MADKQKLRDMLDSLIDQNSEQAQVDFHTYLEDKMREVLNGGTESNEENNEE